MFMNNLIELTFIFTSVPRIGQTKAKGQDRPKKVYEIP